MVCTDPDSQRHSADGIIERVRFFETAPLVDPEKKRQHRMQNYMFNAAFTLINESRRRFCGYCSSHFVERLGLANSLSDVHLYAARQNRSASLTRTSTLSNNLSVCLDVLPKVTFDDKEFGRL